MRRRLIVTLLSAALAVPALVFAASASAAPHAITGDFDGDGKRDLAIGAPGHSRVRIDYTRNPHVAFIHPNATSVVPMSFGAALAVGDFNGDGYSDLAVGAPNFQPPGQTGGLGNPETEGAVFEFYGSPSGLHARPLRLTGPYDGDEPYNLGQALAAADVNGDGRDDLAATLLGTDNGNIQVFRGSSAGLTWTGEQDLDDFEATSLVFADINGDHHPDLIAGSTVDLANATNEDNGDIMVFRRVSTGKLAGTPKKIRGDQVGVQQFFGSSVAAGDVNGDGIADVVVGSQYDMNSAGKDVGSIVLLPGSPTGLSAARHQRFTESRVYGTVHNTDRFGAAVAVAKVSSDRYADVVIGAPGVPVGGQVQAGAVYLLHGTSGGLTLRHFQRLTQASPGVPGVPGDEAEFGAALYAAQLVGTSNADVAIGTPNGSDGAAKGGLVVRLRGADGGLTTNSAAMYGDGKAVDRLGTAIR